MHDLWLDVGCWGDCGCGCFDELAAWRKQHPELPTAPEPLVAWVREHGCPDCGSLEVTVRVMYDDDAGETHEVGDTETF